MTPQTMTTHITDCGLRLATDGLTVWPLTECCGASAREVYLNGLIEPSAVCQRCFRSVGDGYVLAAIIGSPYARRDLRLVVESLTECRKPGECAGEILAHFDARNP